MKTAPRGLAILCLAASMTLAGKADGLSFKETDFAGWTHVSYVGPGGGQASVVVPDGGGSGGSPDPFVQVSQNIGVEVGTKHFGGWTYTPQTNDIVALRYALKYKNFLTWGEGMAFQLLIARGSALWYAGYGLTHANYLGWEQYHSALLLPASFGPNGFAFLVGVPLEIGFSTNCWSYLPVSMGFDDFEVRLLRRVNGSAYLDGYLASVIGELLEVEVWQNANLVETLDGNYGPNGTFAFSPTVSGPAILKFRFRTGLWKAVPVTLTTTPIENLVVNMTNGDCNHDNAVDIGDYSILSANYNMSVGDPGYDTNADLNGDTTVDIGDYAILSGSYGEVGD